MADRKAFLIGSASLASLILRAPAARADGLDYTVPGSIFPISQAQKVWGCWAASYAMLYSWKVQSNTSMADSVASLGQPFVDIFNNDTGLPSSKYPLFEQTANLVNEQPTDYTMTGWHDLLKNFGPLCVTTTTTLPDPNQPIAVHARIIVGILGDGSDPSTTNLLLVDPAQDPNSISTKWVSVTEFTTEYDNVAKAELQKFPGVTLAPQVMHYPAG